MDWEQMGRRVGRQVGRKGREVSDKVKTATELFRLNQRKNEKEANLKEIYAAIGQIFYEEFEGDPDDEMIVLFSKVSETKAEIRRLEEKIQAFGPNRICPDCGAAVTDDAQFCSKCGTNLTETEE